MEPELVTGGGMVNPVNLQRRDRNQKLERFSTNRKTKCGGPFSFGKLQIAELLHSEGSEGGTGGRGGNLNQVCVK